MLTNTASVTAGAPARPAVIATLMNGAVHGVATSTASSPVKKLPRWPERAASPCPAATGSARTKTPDRLRPTANNTQAMNATNTGDWNWNPQPAAAPAWRNASNTNATTENVTSTPAV